MRVISKWIFVALAAVSFVGTELVFASSQAPSPDSSTYLSERASILLAEIKMETAELAPYAETLGALARKPEVSWQSHAAHLNSVRDHINAVRERIIELHRIRRAVLPWQDQAITEVTSHAAKVAASTQAAILYLRDNQHRLWDPEYRNHLTTIAESSMALKETVNDFLAYEKAQQKFQQLQSELELED